MSRSFVLFSDSFDAQSGGAVVLHRLCDLLNRQGRRAFLWPKRRPLFDPERPLRSAYRALKYGERQWRRPFQVFPGFVTPLARPPDLNGAIVVYPEVIDGNPLRANHVVRWLLHKPGFHTGRVNFGAGDRFFFFQEAFNDPALNPDADNLLKTMFIRDDIYRQTNFGARSGSCYLLRKRKGRKIVHDLSDSVLVDDLSHTQLAEVFNRVETCISYDPYTLYSMYAAICGCASVVIPEDGMTKEEWYPDARDRYGVAFGFDDLPEALRTRPLLLPHLKEQELGANASVERFVAKCERYFGG